MLKKETQKGITLISLVITIILLLILATVAISLAVDSDGLFSKAGDAANKWNTSVATEQTAMQNLLNQLGIKEPIKLPEGWKSEVVVNLVEEGGRTAPIPEGYVASQIPGEDTIAGGLVIYQGTEEVTGEKDSSEHTTAMTTRNQYVWIPVDDINDMVMCRAYGAEHNLNETTLQCTTCGTATKLAGKLYWDENHLKVDADATGQTYNATAGVREPAVVADDEVTDAAHGYDSANEFFAHLEEEFENMAKSVAKYGGFYISRYELGVDGTSVKDQTVLKDAIKANNWYGMYNKIENLNTGSSTVPQMIWGCEYDQMIFFLEEDDANESTVRT